MPSLARSWCRYLRKSHPQWKLFPYTFPELWPLYVGLSPTSEDLRPVTWDISLTVSTLGSIIYQD